MCCAVCAESNSVLASTKLCASMVEMVKLKLKLKLKLKVWTVTNGALTMDGF